jgi:hypothetical protein
VPNTVKGEFDLRLKYNTDPFKVTVKSKPLVLE